MPPLVEAPDKLLDEAYASAKAESVSKLICIGTLNGVSSLVPHLFLGTGLPLSSLRMLQTRDRYNVISDFTVTVLFGVGLVVKERLYDFFTDMLHFQDPTPFNHFLKDGFSLFLTGGFHSEIIAAVTFIVAPDGVFIDTIAVSNGRGSNLCKLNPKTFGTTNAYQKLRYKSKHGASFQYFGLGSFLIGLVERCAKKWCTVKDARVYLKMNEKARKFYISCGYKKLPSNRALPPQLLAMVPAFNVNSSSPETSIVSKVATSTEEVAPAKQGTKATSSVAKMPPHYLSSSSDDDSLQKNVEVTHPHAKGSSGVRKEKLAFYSESDDDLVDSPSDEEEQLKPASKPDSKRKQANIEELYRREGNHATPWLGLLLY